MTNFQCIRWMLIIFILGSLLYIIESYLNSFCNAPSKHTIFMRLLNWNSLDKKEHKLFKACISINLFLLNFFGSISLITATLGLVNNKRSINDFLNNLNNVIGTMTPITLVLFIIYLTSLMEFIHIFNISFKEQCDSFIDGYIIQEITQMFIWCYFKQNINLPINVFLYWIKIYKKFLNDVYKYIKIEF